MKRLALFLFFGICAFGGGNFAVWLAPRLATPVAAQSPGRSDGNELLRLSDRFETVARKIAPAVVAVEATKTSLNNNGEAKSRSVEESGSGVLIKVNGQRGVLVLTNNHVISRAEAGQITVNLADNRVMKPVQVWTDPESDVAVLRLEIEEDVPTATLGDSENVRVGQWVLAVGSPFGLNQTVTHGIISARERGQISLGGTIRIKDFLQTDAAINPGSSGGPLVNLDGEVIGLNTAIASNNGSNSGVAFSIPINLVKRVVRQLLEKGTVTRGYLGLQLAQNFEANDALRLGLDRLQGALVQKVYPDTPGEAAGLQADDVILEMDGFPIRNDTHLINMVSAIPAGQKIKLQVWRAQKRVALEATVGDWAKGQERFRAKAPQE
jgi:S1-C subfamily serine protease